MKQKALYAAILPTKTFHGINLSSKAHSAVASSPSSAMYHILRRSLPNTLTHRKKSAIASSARDKLEEEDGGLDKILYEVSTEIEDEKGELLSRKDPNFTTALTVSLAYDIAKKQGGRSIQYMKTAEEALELYFEYGNYDQ